MIYVNQTDEHIETRCKTCGTTNYIDIDNTKKLNERSFLILKKVRCNTCNNSKKLISIVNIPLDNDPIKCPVCQSEQISHNKKGFGLGKAIAGGVLFGGIGLLGGFIGSNKVDDLFKMWS
jgi:hypothetical protein